MTVQGITTIGFIGAGRIGSAVARRAVAEGYRVVLSNSRGPETLADLVAELGPNASAGTTTEAATAGDLVVVTIPLKAIGSVPVEPLAGKVVLDTNNYYSQRDGQIAALDGKTTTSSQLLQDRLPSSHVVKAFNHIQADQIGTDAAPKGAEQRRALAIFGDSPKARETVSALLDGLGFDVVEGGTLADSWRIEPGTPGYGPRATASELHHHLASATR